MEDTIHAQITIAPLVAANSPRLPCPQCSKDYEKNANLKQHLAAVHGIYDRDDDPKASSTNKKHLYRKTREVLADELVRDTKKANDLKQQIIDLEERILGEGYGFTRYDLCSRHKVNNAHQMHPWANKDLVVNMQKPVLMDTLIDVRQELKEPGGLQGDLDKLTIFLAKETDKNPEDA